MTTLDLPLDAAGPDPGPDEQRIALRTRRAPVDRAFHLGGRVAGATSLVLITLIGAFLVAESLPALRRAGLGFFTAEQWFPDVEGGEFGVLAVLSGTVKIAVIALVVAVPVSLGAALFIVEYCPRRLRGPVTSLVDLLAAVPSIVYGLWGREVVAPYLEGISQFLAEHLGWFPLFENDIDFYGLSTLIAGVVVGIMVTPICTSVIREVFSQAPPGEKEGALALGGTRWGMIRSVVIPFGKGGIIGGSMLGMGRALGETIAVTLLISPVFDTNLRITEGGNSISALIASRYKDSSPQGIEALLGAGLVLFALTLVVNTLASVVVSRSRSGADTEI